MFNLFRSSKTRAMSRATIERLYGAIVAQSRRADFYTDFGVPDTLEGRFEMVVLHTVLVCHRLKGGNTPERSMSQDIFDAFAADMDAAMREVGIGDLTVPKKMKKIGEAFYGRAAAYDAALAAADDTALVQALSRNLLSAGEAEPSPEAAALAAYVRAAAAKLDATPFEVLARGVLELPDPAVRENET
ncbi:ubiquinol-cytochrome C chaperone family protein [Xanthobacter autotrophicus]|uniref:ubiquinol-cytochrome C chaperone family protein n=1 Tax=Xanthobacter autotrophicus TaxID=280 RepID=UPI0024A7A0E3|nr:ubiquinol-cytochrome C chaperone family protein [Xanthobacter autotrophicus]MDI4657876.1 ubiquinol-cytochrome C chaperone [Xanthobacter autotrophicus]